VRPQGYYLASFHSVPSESSKRLVVPAQSLSLTTHLLVVPFPTVTGAALGSHRPLYRRRQQHSWRDPGMLERKTRPRLPALRCQQRISAASALNQAQAGEGAAFQGAAAFARALFQFSRPHTLMGTFVSVVSVSMLALVPRASPTATLVRVSVLQPTGFLHACTGALARTIGCLDLATTHTGSQEPRQERRMQ
jgi:hypothetical protein